MFSKKNGIKWIRRFQNQKLRKNMTEEETQYHGGKELHIWAMIGRMEA
jgi:hypothetical protein